MAFPKEIQSAADAKERLKEFYGANLPFIDWYAKTAHFLSCKEEFINELEKVSKDVWVAYNEIPQGHPNRFTRAIIDCARKYQFLNVENIVVFGGALSDQVFKDYVAKGILWKDAFAPEHGEFSHSFQWLAIAKKFGAGAGKWYMETAKHESVRELWTKARQDVVAKKQVVWPWLVDCFPADYYGSHTPSDADSEHALNTFSVTFRCPNNVRREVLEHDWFISLYETHRKRTWEDIKIPAVRAERSRKENNQYVYTKPQRKFVIQDTGAIQIHTKGTHGTGKQWEQPDPQSPVYVRKFQEKGGKTEFIKVQFHDIEGMVPATLLTDVPPWSLMK